MWKNSITRLTTELSHFQLLSTDMKRMLVSYGFYLAAYPLIATFMNAYLWRSNGSIWSIVMYNSGWVIGLPLGFYINGLLLKKFHILRLYFSGLLLQAIIPCLVVFLPFNGLLNILMYGLLYGCGSGLFWANKSYLDLQLTRGSNRIYYNSLGIIIDLLVNILMPVSAGWFIVYMNSIYALDSFIAYKIIMMVGFILLITSGLSVQFTHIQNIVIEGLFVKNPSRNWNAIRMFNILHNVQVGVTIILSSLVVLVLVGGEGILGTLQTITAGLSSIGLYFIGRKTTISSSWKFILTGSIIFFIGTCTLAGIFTWVGGLAYTIVITLAWAFQWSPANSVSMDLLDHEQPDTHKQYAYVCDNELFYNVGRTIGISIIILLAGVWNQSTALRWAPFIVGIIQLPLGIIIYRIVTNILSPTPTAASTSTAS